MQINFGGEQETVITRDEFPLEKAQEVLKNDTIAVLGYGSQGPGQSQNLRDQGFNVIVGQRQDSKTWDKAQEDGWIPGKDLFSIKDAAEKGTIVSYLLSDASQPVVWPSIKKDVQGKTLYVSHGFPIHFNQHTEINPSSDTDIIMVAPKGAGLSVRRNFQNGSGINSSFAVHNNASGNALEKALSMGIGIGSGYMFETTCEREVVSDHVGERAILLGELWALAESSYDALRGEGLSPAEAFINSSEQLTQVILPSIGRSGPNIIYNQAFNKNQLGKVLGYQEAVRLATGTGIMRELYESCRSGEEARISLESNIKPGYRQALEKELADIDNSEMWKIGAEVREKVKDRTYDMRITNFALAGAVLGAMEAQYQVLINNGHSPSEAGNETVEETTESLNQFYQAKGISHLLGVCSTTAQRGALDWGPRFKETIAPIMGFNYNYGQEVEAGTNYTVTRPNMWDVMNTVRELRPGK